MYIKRKSHKQELRTAKEFKGKVTPASGALSGAKGDVRTGVRNGCSFNEDDYLIENKFTDKGFYKLELKIWDKIEGEALRDNFRTPLMQIDIQDLQIIIISSNDLKAKIDYDLGITSAMKTTQKSIRLVRDELIGMFENSKGIYINFSSAKEVKYLVAMKKEEYLSL